MDKNVSFQKWIKKVCNRRPMSDARQLELIALAQSGDLSARNQIIERHIMFVIFMANRYASVYVPVEDMVSDGVMGMMEAITRYDPSKKVKFVTYAYFWIKLWIIRHAILNGRLIRIPSWISENHRKFFQLVERQRSGEDIEHDKEHGDLSALLSKVVSIYSHIGDPDDSAELIEFINAPDDREIADDFKELFDKLKPIEKDIVMMRFGLYTDRPYSLKEIGQKYKVSHERIRQKEATALNKLRCLLRKDAKVLKGELWTSRNCRVGAVKHIRRPERCTY